jgi:hypothetical protein
MWMANSSAFFIGQGGVSITEWGGTLGLTGLTASMIVNALVTSLIVFKIFNVLRKVKGVSTASGGTSLSITSGGKKLHSVIFIIIESGMALFSIQLVRLAFACLGFKSATTVELDTHQFVVGIHEMLNVIIQSIIVIFYIYLTNNVDLTRG